MPRLSRLLDNGLVKAIFDRWQLSGTTALVSGRPKEVTLNSGIDDYFTGGGVVSRPMMIGDPKLKEPKISSNGLPIFYDSAAFAIPPTGVGQYYGTTPRNFLRRPGVVNCDLALFKNIKVGEKRNLSFRWEAYNVFNHTNFSDFNGELNFSTTGRDPKRPTDTSKYGPTYGQQTNANFGRASAARPNRVMQGSLRLSF